MARIISGYFDLDKIPPACIKTRKDGTGRLVYFSETVNDKPDQYGNDVSVSINQTKEERQAKVKKVYLGSGKTVWKNEPKDDVSFPQTSSVAQPQSDDQSLPF